MNGIKLKLRRLGYKLRHDYLSVENVVLAIAVILCLVWTYQSITAMSRNWMLSEQLTTEKTKLALINLEVEAAELENDYYRTDEYKELMARKYLDKAWPGEKMIVLPENSDEAKTKFQKQSVEEEQLERSNVEKWMMFLFPSY